MITGLNPSRNQGDESHHCKYCKSTIFYLGMRKSYSVSKKSLHRKVVDSQWVIYYLQNKRKLFRETDLVRCHAWLNFNRRRDKQRRGRWLCQFMVVFVITWLLGALWAWIAYGWWCFGVCTRMRICWCQWLGDVHCFFEEKKTAHPIYSPFLLL